MSIIEVKNLTKQFVQPVKKPGIRGAIKHLFNGEYKVKTAVDSINFKIDKGESVAYLGRNGAGKSTTIKMLTGVLTPSSGEVVVNGRVPHSDRISNAKQIGVVFGQRTQLWLDIPLIESFYLLKDIYNIPTNTFKLNLENYIEMLELNECLNLAPRRLSLGQRVRGDIIAALLHDPDILFLDEPSIGLDAVAKNTIRNFIRHINKEKETTILLTTHDLESIELLCKRLILIDNSKIVYDGVLEEVMNQFGKFRIIYFTLSETYCGVLENLTDMDVRIDSSTGVNLIISFNRFMYTAGEIINIVSKDANIIDLKINEPSLEGLLKQVYAGELIIK